MKSIDFKIAELRKIKGITQLQLAEELGVTYQAVSKWETKSTMPDISLLPQIADYFDVSIDQLLGVKPIEKTKYITRDTGKSSFWDDKSKYLKNKENTFGTWTI